MKSPAVPASVSFPFDAVHWTALADDASVQSTTLVSPVKHASLTVAAPCASCTRPAHSSSIEVTLTPPKKLFAMMSRDPGAPGPCGGGPGCGPRPHPEPKITAVTANATIADRIARVSISVRVLDVAVGCRVRRRRENVHRRQRGPAFALEIRQLGLGLGFGVALTNRFELVAELRARDFVIDARLREYPLNRLAHFFERAHVVVVRNLLERALDSSPRLRIAHPRHHAHLFDLELLDFALERDQVLLGVLGFRRQLAQLFAQPRAIAFEDVFALNQDERALILVHVGGLPRFLIDFLHLGEFFAQLALELVAHIDDASRRALELVIAAHAIRDGRLVHRLGVARLARFDPAAELASEQFEKS